jgi:hypothetical protein
MKILFVKIVSLFIFLISIQIISNGNFVYSEEPKTFPITVRGLLCKKGDGYEIRTEDSKLVELDSSTKSSVSAAIMEGLRGKLVEMKGKGFETYAARTRKSGLKVTNIDSVVETLPKSVEMNLSGILGKTEAGFYLEVATKEKVKINFGAKVKVDNAEMEKLVGKRVDVKGVGYMEKSAHIYTDVSSVAELKLEAEGFLKKKDNDYFVKTEEKGDVRIMIDENSTVKAIDVDKLIGKKVVIKGVGYMNGGQIFFTSINSVTEMQLIAIGILRKRENDFTLITIDKGDIKIVINDQSKVKAPNLETFSDKKVEVKGAGYLEKGQGYFTAISSIIELAPDSKEMVINGVLSKKGDAFNLLTTENENISFKLNDKTKTKRDAIEKLEGKNVEVKGLGYKKEGTHITQVVSVRELPAK